MTKHLRKQFLTLFVLPVSVFVIMLASELIVYLPLNEAGVILSISILMWIGIGCFVYSRLRSSYTEIDKVLQKLQEGSEIIDIPSNPRGLFSFVLGSLTKIAGQMKHQQEELSEEKVQRLRSMIDGQDKERQRLSRELHDELGQSLIAVKLQLENAGQLSYSQMRASVDQVKGMIDQVIDEVRRITNALLPAALSEFGLMTAIRNRCGEIAASSGIDVTFESEGSFENLDDRSKTYLYRIAQEAITNTVKHARASELNIKISRKEQEVTLNVSDNGKGFIFESPGYMHRNGIQNIRERVALLNGTFELDSKINKGTTLRVTIPYTPVYGKNPNRIGG